MISGPTASQIQAIRTTALVVCQRTPLPFTSPTSQAPATP